MTLREHAPSGWTMAAVVVLILLSLASATGRSRFRTRADADRSQPLVIDLDAVSVDPDTTIPVSVVIPAFERAGQITAAVASALAQVPAPLEVIVIDDASNDDTARVAEAAGATVVRNQTNLGQGPTRNVGIRAAGAEWVAFLDSDDVWHAGHLGRLWSHRHDHVLVAAAGQGTENGRIYGHPGPGPLELDGPGDTLAGCNPVLCSGSMVRREVALAVGGFSDRRRAQDLEFVARVLERGTGLALPDIGVAYVQHTGQVSSDLRSTRREHLAVVRSFRDRPWFRSTILASAEATVGWDSLRVALRERAWSDSLRLLPTVGGSPVRAKATMALLRQRRYERRRIAG